MGLPISRILLLPSNILTLTHTGRVYVWENLNSERQPRTKDSKAPTKPLWTLDQERLGEPVKDMVGSSTRLLLIRPSSVTLLDFWEGNSPSRRNMATKEKKSDSGSKATISEV